MDRFCKKCVVLYSGGLDSLLVIHIMSFLGFEVYPLFIKTPFYKKDIEHLRKQLAGISLRLNVVESEKDYMEVVKNPEFGYGKNLNPCIDCKIFFFKEAKKFMEKVGACFIVTGEVLGQRPMSQRSYSILRSIEKKAQLKDLVLRPLSAKCLPETEMEKEGIIDKSRLFCITGRSRKEQFELAKRFGIEAFESPAGGCLLTDKAFSKRAKDIIENGYQNRYELKLLTIGRHFKINKKRFIVSRNKEETQYLFNHFQDKLPFFRCFQSPGAAGVFIENPNENEVDAAASILKRYSKKADTIEYIYEGIAKTMKPKEMSDNDVEFFKI